jgi:hypothetical protein
MTKKSTISGPGASDFLTAEEGGDQPRDEDLVGRADELEPDLEPPDPATEREKTIPPDRGGRRSA